MKKIRLNKEEKKILLWIEKHPNEFFPKEFPEHTFNLCCHYLESVGLVRCGRIEGGQVEAVRLTSFGKYYLLENPKLKNPLNWDRIILIITLLISLVGLFTGCISLI